MLKNKKKERKKERKEKEPHTTLDGNALNVNVCMFSCFFLNTIFFFLYHACISYVYLFLSMQEQEQTVFLSFVFFRFESHQV